MNKHFRVAGMLATRLEESGISVASVLRSAALPQDFFQHTRILVSTPELFALWRAITRRSPKCKRRWAVPEYDSVGTVAFFRERHRVESATTARVLSALPADGLSYAPHPGSSIAGTTAWTIVRGLRAALELLKSPSVAVGLECHPDHHTLVAQFGETSNAIAESLENISRQNWCEERIVT